MKNSSSHTLFIYKVLKAYLVAVDTIKTPRQSQSLVVSLEITQSTMEERKKRMEFFC